MTSFYWTCWKTAKTILQALALGLGIDEESIMKPHGGHYNQLRLLHYPPIPASWIDEGKFARMPAHTDWTTITMLFQDDCGGLQVESPSQPGQFIDVDPIPDALVLNVGDLMMRWSNGKKLLDLDTEPDFRNRFSQVYAASSPASSSSRSIRRRAKDDKTAILDTIFCHD